jgi:DNA-binding MurR/RpiR family transcriptional regulator
MSEADNTQVAVDVTDLTARNVGITGLRARIREHWSGLSPAAQDVCRVLAEITPERILYMSAVELGTETRTSNATVVRALQSLGYSGLAELKSTVAKPFTDATAPEERARRRVESTGGDLQNVWDRIITETADRIELLRRGFSLKDYRQAVDLLVEAREVKTFAFGATFVVAEHLALKLRRMGQRARACRASGFALPDDLLAIERGDVVVLFAGGRILTDITVLLDRVRTVGGSSVLITDELVDELTDSVTVTLRAPHTPTGLTGEPVTALVLADALAQGVATSDVERTVEASHTLTTLRQQMGY